jgi:putative Mg2+ transporter-C (MgtC) family protein
MLVSELDIILRLAAATAAGALIGFDRDSRDKPAGMRTLGLVALGAAVTALAAASLALDAHPDAMSRVMQGAIQGVVAGVGFIGAGVMLHGARSVSGVTTAATVWTAAALGLACGLGAWRVAGTAMVLIVVLFFVVKPVERWLLARLGHDGPPAAARANDDGRRDGADRSDGD